MLQLTHHLPERWRAAVHAALAGDALGVPHEFKSGAAQPGFASIEMVMPAAYPKTYAAIPYGRWSDDGSQLLALLDVFVRTAGRYDERLFLQNLIAWYQDGAFQAGGTVFDIGGQTRAALDRRKAGLTPEPLDPAYCGNGSLMRVLCAAALPDTWRVSEDDAIRAAMAQSDITHPQLIGRVACALYVELIWRVAARPEASVMGEVGEAEASLRRRGILTQAELGSLNALSEFRRKQMPTGGGFVANSFWSAIWALERSSSVSETLRRAVSLGNDTDTTACIAGGLAGARWGLDAQTTLWLGQMDLSYPPPTR